MPEFTDATGQSWTVALDGLSLAELREKAAVDIVQDGLYFLEEREDVLTKALLVLCREQRDERKLTDRQFSKLIAGQVAELALDAVRGAATFFFRPSRWSAIQSRSQQRKELDEQYQALRPMLEMLNRPDMPAAMRQAVMSTITEQIEAATSSRNSALNPSASGLDASLANAAGDSPDSSVSTPAV
jgi:hypothetical protein